MESIQEEDDENEEEIEMELIKLFLYRLNQ